ncbi:MAG TPA: YIP1 family protein [Candidatus Angelobacter sp.]|nr:YIP1 family protein [Candidatus Angelobacter sp.]
MNFPTSQTPPPPFPNQPVAPAMAPEPIGPGLSEPQRLMNVLIAPSKTFEDLRRKASWWVPWVVTSIFTIIFAVVVVQKIDMGHFIQQQMEKSPSAQKRMEQLSPEQRARATELQGTIAKVAFFAFPLISLIGGLIMAAVFMAIFNFILAAEVPFERAMAVVFYSYIPFIISSILLTASLLFSSDSSNIDLANPMPTNLGFFMDPHGNRFLYEVASALDIFSIWVVVLLGLGFATASSNRKPSKSTGIVTMLVVFAIFILCRSAWRAFV